MGLLFHKLRTFIRTNFAPIPYGKAKLWQRRMHIIYTICAWNLFGYVVYKLYTNKDQTDSMPLSLYMAKNLELGNTKLIKISKHGLETYDLTEEEINKQYEEYEKNKISQ
ncbi:uncharacterized protein LOC111622940 [Centruroides sculpturatus]|uniref:uncharacterized protein LOC111622940 n=1 Tax=Centruroides sculpturatus TaxID=218467 RepID=UPI000C6D51F9|nr:uncharacterized protein LOC111622940 [Centruroides sculpturatus]